jgi:hypothetical protein
MNHYVYYSYEEWGRGYIGVRSCKCLPEEDCSYLGSFKDKTFTPEHKIILSTFGSRTEAVEAEILLHNHFEVQINLHFANQAKQTSTGYDRKGVESTEKVRQKYKEAYDKFRKEKPELYEERKAKVLEGIQKFRKENPEKVKQQLLERGKKGGMKVAARRKEDLEFDLKLRNAVKDSMKIRFTPEYQQMMIDKAREATAKPVRVTFLDGSTIDFESIRQFKDYFNVGANVLYRKINGLPTRKLKELEITFLNN